MNIKKYILSVVAAIFFVAGLVSSPAVVSADNDMFGSAWSGNVGWITFNCLSTNTCGAGNTTYSVKRLSAGNKLTGYAWSDNIGWIYFNPSLASCPVSNPSVANCSPQVEITSNNGFKLKGFALALSGSGSVSSPSFSGYIDLNNVTTGAPDTSSGVMVIPAGSYAWGSDLIGWIDMSSVSFGKDYSSWQPANDIKVSITSSSAVNPFPSQSLNLNWNITFTDPTKITGSTSCVRKKIVGGVDVSDPNWSASWSVSTPTSSGSKTVTSSHTTSAYSITCSNASSTNKNATAVFVSEPVLDIGLVSLDVSDPNLNAEYVTANSSIKLQWYSPAAASCRGSKIVDGVVQPNETNGMTSPTQWSGKLRDGVASMPGFFNTGSKIVNVGAKSATYVLTCNDLNSGKSKSIQFTVSVAVQPVVTFYATPASFPTAIPTNNTTLYWTAKNADTCDVSKVTNTTTNASTLILQDQVISSHLITNTPNSSTPVTIGNTSQRYKIDCYLSLIYSFNPFPNIVWIDKAKALHEIKYVDVPVYSALTPMVTLSANPSSFSSSSGSTILSWTATNATPNSCTLTRVLPTFFSFGSGLPLISSRSNVAVTSNSVFRVACYNGTKEGYATINVNVGVPTNSGPTVTLYSNAVDDSVPNSNRSIKLYWDASATANMCRLTRNYDGLQLYYGNTTKNTAATGISENVPGSPGQTTTYTIECTDTYSQPGYASKSIQVAPLVPAVVKFGIGDVDTRNIEAVIGTTQTLFWEISGVSANSCRASTSPGSPWKSGNIIGNSSTPVTIRNTPGSHIFTLYNCLDMYGATVGPILLNVTAVNPTPVVTAEALPVNAKIGENVKIYWTSTHANSCAISNVTKNTSVASGQPTQMDKDATPPAAGYSVTVADPGPTVFRVTCSNPTKSGSDDVTVNFDPLTKKIKVIER